MLCKVCRDGLEGIWDPLKTKRISRVEEWKSTSEMTSIPSIGVEVVEVDESSAKSEPESYMFGHHLTKESFLQSFGEGCVMCTRFRPSTESEDLFGTPHPKLAAVGYYSVFSVSLERPMMFMMIGDHQGGFEIVPHNAHDPDMNFNISPSTEDETTWHLIQGWLKTCTETHAKCNKRLHGNSTPPRFLEFTTVDQVTTFRLVKGDQIDPKTNYITLSHDWDITRDIRSDLLLTSSTVTKLADPQPISLLPQTLRDAVNILARLSISHLWIDFLCIQADNPTENDPSSPIKQFIFANAFLNISALGASNPDTGLFFARNPDKVNPTVFNLPISGPDSLSPHRFRLEKGWAWRHFFDREPLAKYGKAVVERLFARRTLHFGSQMLFWECSKASCCETHPRGVYGLTGYEPRATDGESEQLWKQLLNGPDRRVVGDPLKQLLTDWYSITMLYSQCRLKGPGDKLSVLGGLAREMQGRMRELGCEDTAYLAGIWRCSLPGGLIWNIRTRGVRPQQYRAPSWSWAAVDGYANPHDWIQSEHELLASVVKVEVTTKNDDEFGEVTSGSLVLKGYPALANVFRNENTHLHRAEDMLVKSLADLTNGKIVEETPPPPGKAKYNSFWTVSFDTEKDMRGDVIVLPIWMKSWARSWNIVGLALSRVNRHYTRVGHFSLTVSGKEEAEKILQRLSCEELNIL